MPACHAGGRGFEPLPHRSKVHRKMSLFCYLEIHSRNPRPPFPPESSRPRSVHFPLCFLPPGRKGFGRYAPSGLSLPLRFACGPLPLTSRGRLRRPKPIPAGLPKSSKSSRPEHSAPGPPVWPLRVSTEWQVLLHRSHSGGRFSEEPRKNLGISSEWQRHDR